MDAFEIKPLKSKAGSWVLALGAEELRLAAASDDTVILMSRQAAEQQLEVVPLWAGQAAITLRRPGQSKLEFRLNADQRSKLNAWLGPPTPARLRAIFKRRYAFGLVLAVLLIFTSLPLDGDPSAGIPPVPFNGISFVLGVGLAFFWVISKVRPTRILFAADSVWFLLLAASAFLDMASGRSSLLWLLWVPLPLWLSWAGFSQFRSFSPGRTSAGARQAA
jgi:hypothetical protein